MLAFYLLLVGSWVGNIIKFTDCDFEAPYRCEVIHGAGILPGVALVTAWFGTDKHP